VSKIVIFGGEGFIGTALCSLFDKHGIEYAAPTEARLNLTTFHGWADVRNIVQDDDTVIMIAAYTNEKGNSPALTEANIRMAANMVAGLQDRNIAHFVYISSDSVFGKGDAPPFFNTMNEETPIAPDMLYGFMHATREQYFRESIPSEKLTIIRPCAVYGIGDTHNAYGINSFLREAKEKGTITLFGNGEEKRPSIYVGDLVEIIFKAVQEKICGVFNANCGVSWSFKEVAEFIKNTLGNIEILSKQRTIPIFHRYFDNTKLRSTFHAPMVMDVGITKLTEEYKIGKIL
jgi:UDP-glucose 4-epimerase